MCFGSRQLSQDGRERSRREMIGVGADVRKEDSLQRLGPQLVFCRIHMIPNFCYTTETDGTGVGAHVFVGIACIQGKGGTDTEFFHRLVESSYDVWLEFCRAIGRQWPEKFVRRQARFYRVLTGRNERRTIADR